jgi:acyl-CoA synthetase (NDP forming)
MMNALPRTENLRRLFEPSSVAVLGASDSPSKVGSRPILLLQKYGFAGDIYPINPGRAEIAGLKAYPDLAALPQVPDVVVFCVPAKDVVAAVRQCAERGVGAAIIYTSGFGEIDEAGRETEQELRAIASESGLIVCGPNCQGTANFHNGAVLNFTSALMRERLPSGNIGLVTQSGLVGGLMVTSCCERGLGIGYLVSTGNEAGMTLSDAIRHMAGDERIRAIAGYVEQVRDLPAFREAVLLARRNGKPVFVLKVGRSPDAARAAASHTGSLAGAAELYDAAFAEMGVIVAESLEELSDLTMAFATIASKPAGKRVGILTNSGGLGVFSADEVFRQGLSMAAFAPSTNEAIAGRLPDFGSAANPVDISTQAFSDIDAVGSHLDHICADDGVDMVAVTFGLQFLNARPLAEHIIRVSARTDKPLFVSWVSSDEAAAAALRAAGIPVFSDPARAIRCARHLADFAALPVSGGSDVVAPELPESVLCALREAATSGGALSEHAMLRVLARAGLPVPSMRLCSDGPSAAAAFREIGAGAVAVKIASPDIVHKSEAGGVTLNVTTAAATRAAAEAMLTSVRSSHPEAKIDGVIVAEMIGGGSEVYIGAKRDPLLGPFVMVGFGGIFIEIMNDIAIAPAPVSADQAEALIRKLRAFAILDGARGKPPADIAALADVVVKVSMLIAASSDLAELDLNPVVVRPRGQGVVVLDASAMISRFEVLTKPRSA